MLEVARSASPLAGEAAAEGASVLRSASPLAGAPKAPEGASVLSSPLVGEVAPKAPEGVWLLRLAICIARPCAANAASIKDSGNVG